MENRDSFAQQEASADHVVSFFRKLRLDWLLLHFPPRLVKGGVKRDHWGGEKVDHFLGEFGLWFEGFAGAAGA
jgi:hypothetical protein